MPRGAHNEGEDEKKGEVRMSNLVLTVDYVSSCDSQQTVSQSDSRAEERKKGRKEGRKKKDGLRVVGEGDCASGMARRS